MVSRFEDLPLICPHDGAPLQCVDRMLRCAHGHTFDISRQGYVNLIPVAQKASRQPGDSVSMVQARARVLNTGLFAPVALALERLVAEAPGSLVADSGCGDGWFSSRVANAEPQRRLLAFDVSKHAVKAAAQRRAGFASAVASGKALPLAQGTVDTLLCVFGFPFWQHWADWQTAGQRVITVDPASDHLLELRQIIYADVRRHAAPNHAPALVEAYRRRDDIELRAQAPVENWLDLLEMTPHGRRCSPAAREKLRHTDADQVTLNVRLQVFERLDRT